MDEKSIEKELSKLENLSEKKRKLYTDLFDEFILLMRSSGIPRALNALLNSAPPPILLRHIEFASGAKIEEMMKNPEDERAFLPLFSFWCRVHQRDRISEEEE